MRANWLIKQSHTHSGTNLILHPAHFGTLVRGDKRAVTGDNVAFETEFFFFLKNTVSSKCAPKVYCNQLSTVGGTPILGMNAG